MNHALCQQVFSAACIAHVEAAYDDDATRNTLCAPVPHPDDNVDFLRTSLAALTAARRWGQDAALQGWLMGLGGLSHSGMAAASEAQRADMLTMAMDAETNVQGLLDSIDGSRSFGVQSIFQESDAVVLDLIDELCS